MPLLFYSQRVEALKVFLSFFFLSLFQISGWQESRGSDGGAVSTDDNSSGSVEFTPEFKQLLQDSLERQKSALERANPPPQLVKLIGHKCFC